MVKGITWHIYVYLGDEVPPFINTFYNLFYCREKSNFLWSNLKEQLISEGQNTVILIRNNSVLTKELKEAARILKDNKNIIIRKADKSNTCHFK